MTNKTAFFDKMNQIQNDFLDTEVSCLLMLRPVGSWPACVQHLERLKSRLFYFQKLRQIWSFCKRRSDKILQAVLKLDKLDSLKTNLLLFTPEEILFIAFQTMTIKTALFKHFFRILKRLELTKVLDFFYSFEIYASGWRLRLSKITMCKKCIKIPCFFHQKRLLKLLPDKTIFAPTVVT